jgi:hypothetical protein
MRRIWALETKAVPLLTQARIGMESPRIREPLFMQERRRAGRKLHRQAGGTAERWGGTAAALRAAGANRQDCDKTK